MKQYGFVYITVSNREEAKKIARVCLTQKRVACANILPPILSCYEWKGRYNEEEEVILILKTRRDQFKKLCETVKKHHSYTCPCIVFIPLMEGYKPFLEYIDSQLKATPPTPP